MKMKKLIFICIFISSILLVPFGLSEEKAPDFSLEDINGKTFTLSNHRGRIVLIDFMATWCPPCRWEMQELKKVRKNTSEEDVIMISIDVDYRESVDDIKRVFGEYVDEWIFALDTKGVSQLYGIKVIPTLVIIDREGYISFRHEGAMHSDLLISKIEEIGGPKIYVSHKPSHPKAGSAVKFSAEVHGKNVRNVRLWIQECGKSMCYFPVEINMSEVSSGHFDATYTLRNDTIYFHYKVLAEVDGKNIESQTFNVTVKKKSEKTPGFELMIVLIAMLLIFTRVKKHE